MSLATTFSLTLRSTLTKLINYDATPTLTINKAFSDVLADGTAIDEADLLYADTRTISGTTSEDAETLDLSALPDRFGVDQDFARVKMILIHNKSVVAANSLIVGGAAANAFESIFDDAGSTVVVGPGGVWCLYTPSAAGYVVGTDVNLKIVNAGVTDLEYDCIIVGCST